MKTYQKNILWAGVYLAGLLAFCFAAMYFSQKDLLGAFIAFPIFMLLFTIIVMKDVKIFSVLSFVTMLLTAFMVFAVAAEQKNGIFLSAEAEKVFMIVFPIILSFVLVNGIFWGKTKQSWKRLVGFILSGFSVFFLLVFGMSSPNYSENFIYTRIFLIILFILSVYLIRTKKRNLKITGILGVVLSIIALILSALLFAGQTYTPVEKQEAEIIAFIDPKVKEMFAAYNNDDYDNFCKYCGADLMAMNAVSPMIDKKADLGNLVSFGEPKISQVMDFYYVEYQVRFEKQASTFYLSFMLTDFSEGSTIYGFSVFDQPDL
ncbi:MAG: hypothetical protein WC702_03925 [Patescibacteria group bacterium]|jgi:hypothetical protein